MKEHLRTAIWRDIMISLRKRRFNSADGDEEEKNMTVKECYEQMGADYEGVLGRLRSEVLIKKFAKKFLDDGSFRSLKDNLVQKNGEEAFRAAHTLKGVCQNLGFDNLFAPSQELTEKLRGATTIEGADELFAAVEKEYDRTCEALRKIA